MEDIGIVIKRINGMRNVLTEWFRQVEIADNLIYKQGHDAQVSFVRDTLPMALANTPQEYTLIKELELQVKGFHTSKSVVLPVYGLEWKGFEFTFRNNFHDWKLSVKTPYWCLPLKKSLVKNLVLAPDSVINPIYCEGFDSRDVYGSYTNACGLRELYKDKNFTIELSNNNYHLYTFLFLLNRYYISKDQSECYEIVSKMRKELGK